MFNSISKIQYQRRKWKSKIMSTGRIQSSIAGFNRYIFNPKTYNLYLSTFFLLLSINSLSQAKSSNLLLPSLMVWGETDLCRPTEHDGNQIWLWNLSIKSVDFIIVDGSLEHIYVAYIAISYIFFFHFSCTLRYLPFCTGYIFRIELR